MTGPIQPFHYRNEVKDVADQARRKANGDPPISRHPLFPAIVALWFGALFGLGSIAISPALVEQVVAVTRIDAIIPMAAPPLGTTAQLLVALFMTGLGGVVGVLVARRIACVKTETHDSRPASIAADCLPPAVRVRRITEGESALTPAREQHHKARDAAILNVAEFDLESFDAPLAAPDESNAAPVPAAAEHAGKPEIPDAEPAPEQTNPLVPARQRGAIVNPLFDTYSRDIGARAVDAVDDSDQSEVFPAPEAPPAVAGSTAAGRIATAELDSLSQVELLERLALAMARRRDGIFRAALETEREPETEPFPAADAGAPAASEASGIQMPRFEEDAAPRPIGTGLHMPAQTHEDEAAAPQVPAALRPVAFHEPDEDDVLPGYIPPRHIGIARGAGVTGFTAATPVPLDDSEEDEGDEEGEVLHGGYSSLLDLSRPSGTRRQFARIDECEADEAIRPLPIPSDQDEASIPAPYSVDQDQPLEPGTRPFDAPGAQASEETEKALRAALATLQRMSGAA